MKYIIFLLTFLFIFGMNIPGLGLDVGIIINIILLCVMPIVLKGKYIIPKNILILLICLLIDLFICLFIPIGHGTYDFSIIPSKINIILSLFNIYQITLFIYYKYDNPIFILTRFLLWVLALQSILIIYSLLNTDFATYIANLSKPSSSVERMFDLYGGARGLGWTNYSAFGLALIFAALSLILFYSYYKKYISSVVFIILLFLSSIAGLSAGRSFILGPILGVLPLIKSKYAPIYALLFFIIIVSVLSLDINSIDNSVILTLYQYSFEPILNYIDTGSFATTSTSYLIEKMYFPLTEKQLLIGDGYYTDPINNLYYLGTDAGYMRFVLYYGLFFSIALYSCFLVFCISIIKVMNNDKYSKYLIIAFVICSLIFHYKGEVILFASGFNRVIISLLFMLALQNMKSVKLKL